MTKKKKIALATGIIAAIPLVALMTTIYVYAMLFGISEIEWQIKHKGWTKIDYYEERWGIYIADDVTVEYDYSTQGGWFGEGENYTVCKFEKTPQEFLRTFDENFDSIIMEKYFDIIAKMQDSDIDKSKIVFPDSKCKWRMKKTTMDTIVFAYDTVNKTMYIAESLM
ncbi:MAG: hypothetical protein K2N53_02250 [Clostridia bacterium]|nr:hypothetical protein [Clostridia bacterium]MDE7348464.1 hypothetical protein [Clostridia bacterium]